MIKTDFYTLKDNTEQARMLFVCRLCEKACNQGMSVYIQVNTSEIAQELDNLLWSFRPESFIPHALTEVAAELGEELGEESVPVLIGSAKDCPVTGGLLINLADNIPAFSENFDRIAEVVISDEQAKAVSRTHWLAYKEAGHELDHHQI